MIEDIASYQIVGKTVFLQSTNHTTNVGGQSFCQIQQEERSQQLEHVLGKYIISDQPMTPEP
jgi:hypothetical protein